MHYLVAFMENHIYFGTACSWIYIFVDPAQLPNQPIRFEGQVYSLCQV